VEISVETNVAPKMQEAEELVAKEFSSQPENIKIRKIKGNFGSARFIITANIYNSKDSKEKTEKKSKKEKSAKAETKSETKTEEKKE
jgi:ribosomal protein S24E